MSRKRHSMDDCTATSKLDLQVSPVSISEFKSQTLEMPHENGSKEHSKTHSATAETSHSDENGSVVSYI